MVQNWKFHFYPIKRTFETSHGYIMIFPSSTLHMDKGLMKIMRGNMRNRHFFGRSSIEKSTRCADVMWGQIWWYTSNDRWNSGRRVIDQSFVDLEMMSRKPYIQMQKRYRVCNRPHTVLGCPRPPSWKEPRSTKRETTAYLVYSDERRRTMRKTVSKVQ